MKQFEVIGNSIFGREFTVDVPQDGIDIKSRNDEYAIVGGFLTYSDLLQVRENGVVMERFNSVEDIVGPILKRNHIVFKSYGGFHATIQQVLPLNKLLMYEHIFFSRYELSSNI